MNALDVIAAERQKIYQHLPTRLREYATELAGNLSAFHPTAHQEYRILKKLQSISLLRHEKEFVYGCLFLTVSKHADALTRRELSLARSAKAK
jgi:predicted transcriptional regulator